MSLLYRVLFAAKCKSTHHKLALDALRHLKSAESEPWQKFFLRYAEPYLEGAKAPDDKFKDFKNHVLHVREGYWGGAVTAARDWYDKTVESLRENRWSEAAYNAGVLSHYVTDPFQPLHTGQSEAEGIVHRPAEWSIFQSYDALQALLESDLGGYPSVATPTGADWLAQLIRRGAEAAREHYEPLLAHYSLAAGVADPPAALDDDLRRRIARQIGLAVASLARILDRAIQESGATPPWVETTLLGVLTQLTVPICWVTRKLADRRDRAQVEAIYAEFQRTGKVLESLPEDERAVRALHAKEVLRKDLADLDREVPAAPGKAYQPVGEQPAKPQPAEERRAPREPQPATPQPSAAQPLAAKPAAAQIAAPKSVVEPAKPDAQPGLLRRLSSKLPWQRSSGEPAQAKTNSASQPATSSSRYYLRAADPVEQAPSIGPKMARRLEQAGVRTVDDLLHLDASHVAQLLDLPQIDGATVRAWQQQSDLMCRIKGLRGHDAQLLTGCRYTEAAQVAQANPATLAKLLTKFAASPEGQRRLRGAQPPTAEEVQGWVAVAAQSAARQAA